MVPVGLFHQTPQLGHGLDLITTETVEFPAIKLEVVAICVEIRGIITMGLNRFYSLSTFCISFVAKSFISVIDTKLFVAFEPVVFKPSPTPTLCAHLTLLFSVLASLGWLA